MFETQRVFPIANSFYSITQASVRVNCSFKSFRAEPKDFQVEIIHFGQHESSIIRLSDSQLDELIRNIDRFRAEVCDEYFYPETDCCSTKRPRDEVTTDDDIYCLPGYGCQAEEEEVSCQAE